MSATIQAQGFPVLPLPKKDGVASDWEEDAQQTVRALEGGIGRIDYLVVDHYDLDARWENKIRPNVRALMAIDDLANRPHAVDILLDQNFRLHPHDPYRSLLPEHCRSLLGPRYALLRREFAEQHARRRVHIRATSRLKLNICFGGSDPDGMTLFALRVLGQPAFDSLDCDVVVGAANPHRIAIASMCASHSGRRLHVSPSNMAALMAEADLALGGAGSMIWERCAVGLPSIVVTIAPNQETIAADCHDAGILRCLGESYNLTETGLAQAILDLCRDIAARQKMADKAYALVDGMGAERVVDVIYGRESSLRLDTRDDSQCP